MASNDKIEYDRINTVSNLIILFVVRDWLMITPIITKRHSILSDGKFWQISFRPNYNKLLRWPCPARRKSSAGTGQYGSGNSIVAGLSRVGISSTFSCGLFQSKSSVAPGSRRINRLWRTISPHSWTLTSRRGFPPSHPTFSTSSRTSQPLST